ncbi:MAG: acetyl-CoA carboxylase biotin carboxyl carrier protein [Salibacteraceae bacterium]|jgi:acetyl-CoA carboxylase biotin carboxyl carrier protein
MDIDKIQALIKFVSKQGVSEVELETEDFKITIKSDKNKEPQIIQAQMPMMQQMQTPMHAPVPVAHAPSAPIVETIAVPAKDENANYITVKSPMIGTFYRSAGPGKPMFIEVGDSIKEGSVTCIVEAMKLFNEIESEISGTIVKILIDDATPVEYDQPLFLVDPS